MNFNARHWRLETDDDNIAWLYFDKADAGANVLSREVLEELDAILEQLAGERPRGLVILSAKTSGFIAGADVSEFTAIDTPTRALELIQRGQGIMDHIERLAFPTVALIHGYCLGGGLELALACRYRIAADEANTRLGLPEVRLGIHPGFGGTVRSIRLLGAPAAMDLMLTGRTVSARAAKKIGMVDHAVPLRHLKNGARSMIRKPPPPHRARRWQQWLDHRWLRPGLARFLKYNVAKKADRKHYPAPYALIDLWAQYGDRPERMLTEEANSVARLIIGDTARNLVRVFQLQNQLKTHGRGTDFKAKHVHVIGGGVMGGDIAAWCALQGLRVTIQDQRIEALGAVLSRAHKLFTERLKLQNLVQAAMDRLMPDVNGDGLMRADVIIEAIFENADAKQALFRDIERKVKGSAILATNTSSIPLEVIGNSLAAPARLVGLHFFNPVSKMPLIEVVAGPDTDAGVVNRASAFARQIDRLPLQVTSTPGFLVNRILMPYLMEAVVLESEGVPATEIDRAATDFGMPMGPIELADTVGLDICLSVADILSKGLSSNNFTTTIPERLKNLVAAQHLGRKSGQGFYRYKKGKPVKARLPRDREPSRDVANRLMLRLLNEAVACLRENVVDNSDALDAGVIFGTGFAPFRGGPLHYLDQAGANQLLATLRELEQRHGKRFAPDAGWTQLV